MTSLFGPSHLRRRVLVLASAIGIGLAGCSPPNEDVSENATEVVAADARSGAVAEASADRSAADAANTNAANAPGANPDVAPGVAFAYRFAFRLPDAAVAEAQERHVAACGALGRARCRVTGMDYNQGEDGRIDASLAFLLDPALASSFARTATAAVTALDGLVETSTVGGEDVGTGITDSQAQSARLGGDVVRLRERLAQPGLSANERRDLQAQISDIEGQLGDEEQVRRGGEARLAVTPVAFTYAGQVGFAGLDRDSPFSSALSASTESFANASAFVLMLVGLLLPWALLLGGGILGLRWLRKRNARISAPTTE